MCKMIAVLRTEDRMTKGLSLTGATIFLALGFALSTFLFLCLFFKRQTAVLCPWMMWIAFGCLKNVGGQGGCGT